MSVSLENYYDEIWNNIIKTIRDSSVYDEYIFNMIFNDSKIISIRKNVITVSVVMSMSRLMMVQEKEKIESYINKVIKNDPPYILNPILSTEVDSIDLTEAESEEKKEENDSISPEFTFDNFVVGESNRQAQAAAIGCAFNPGNFYNPLFIYGDSGLGKTHLLHAIGNYIKKHHPSKKILYIPTYDLINMYIDSTGRNQTISTQELSDRLKNVDVLLIDDIQFLSGKTKTNDFFFQIYNSLVNNRKQIVLTSDKSPYDLNNTDIEERLVSRFASGLTVTITTPEFNTRLEILKMKVKEHNRSGQAPSIEDDDLAYIATHCTGDVRKMEGVLNQLMFYQIQFTDVDTRTALKDILKTNMEDENHNPEYIIRTVGDYYHLSKAQLMSKSRSKSILTARHMAMYMCRRVLDLPFNKIGGYFNNCDHTTVMNACGKIEKKMKNEPTYTEAIREIEGRLKNI